MANAEGSVVPEKTAEVLFIIVYPLIKDQKWLNSERDQVILRLIL
jgi:hypothetical protein